MSKIPMSKITEKEIVEKIIEICFDKVYTGDMQESDFNAESNFKFDLGMDSLDFVELTMEVEKEFDIHIPDDQLTDVLTVGALANLVVTRIK